MKRYLAFLPLLALVAGCPVTQPQDTPVEQMRLSEPKSGSHYWLYVPSYYSTDQDWPLVVTLHGTHGWDGSSPQIKEWKNLAEEKGFIVAAPDLRSVQGILPVNHALWMADLESDEAAILAVLEDVAGKYRIDRGSVLLTGFSAGGYPMYYVGLRNPQRFNMLVARACNSSIDIFEHIGLTDEARRLPVRIFWGKDDLKQIADQSWDAIRWLSEHGFKHVDWDKTAGGHLRRPETAYKYWQKVLPKRHRRDSK